MERGELDSDMKNETLCQVTDIGVSRVCLWRRVEIGQTRIFRFYSGKQ